MRSKAICISCSSQGFEDQAEIDRYAGFMEALAELVADKYEGSLKAEHGTGRNMAPFVEREWGAQAFALMRRIKALLDPQNLLNPGVLLNDDPQIHLKNLKPMPAVSPLLDRCIECGFCEPQCPSHGLTLSPRQRIVSAREMARLACEDADGPRLAEFRKTYAYAGDETCAGCSLCSTVCPLEIDTGVFIRELRSQGAGPAAKKIGDAIAPHFAGTLTATRVGLAAADVLHRIVGTKAMQAGARLAREKLGAPLWTPSFPRGNFTRTPAPNGGGYPGPLFPKLRDARHGAAARRRQRGCARGRDAGFRPRRLSADRAGRGRRTLLRPAFLVQGLDGGRRKQGARTGDAACASRGKKYLSFSTPRPAPCGCKPIPARISRRSISSSS